MLGIYAPVACPVQSTAGVGAEGEEDVLFSDATLTFLLHDWCCLGVKYGVAIYFQKKLYFLATRTSTERSRGCAGRDEYSSTTHSFLHLHNAWH